MSFPYLKEDGSGARSGSKSKGVAQVVNWRYWRIFRWTWPRNDPRRYGAIPDGFTDCTAAIQRAIDDSQIMTLWPGTYQVTSCIRLPTVRQG